MKLQKTQLLKLDSRKKAFLFPYAPLNIWSNTEQNQTDFRSASECGAPAPLWPMTGIH